MKTIRVIRATTASSSLDQFLRGQLQFLNKHYDVSCLAGDDLYISEIEKREGIKVNHLPMKRGISPILDFISLFRAFLYFRKIKPTIVHSMTPKAGLICMLGGYLARVPIRMHTFTGLIFPSKKGYFQKLLIFMDKLICSCATDVYPEGNGVKTDLLAYSITHKPLRVLGSGNVSGVDFTRYSIDSLPVSAYRDLKAELNIDDNSIVFLFIGRLVRDKGIIELVQSFERLHQVHSNTKLLLVGPLEQDLDPLPKQTLELIGSHAGISHLGYQNDVRPYIAISDILTFPSYREGFPNVPLQCGAYKKALILSDINGCNEIVKHGKSGLLVPPKDTDSLAEAMFYLLENKERRIAFGEAVYRHVKAHFQQEKVWQALLEEYDLQLKKK